MTDKAYCVYCHTSPSGKKYIGLTCRKPEKRWNYGNGYADSEYFYRAIQKYGWGAFTHEIIADGLTWLEASEMERRLIEEYDTTNRDKGYNIDLGGISCDKRLSDETKRKIGDANRGKYTEAQREAAKHRRNPHYHHSDAIKKLIGDNSRGRIYTEEMRKHMSEAHKGQKLSEENKENLRRINMRKVRQYTMDGEFVKEYESLKAAEEETGILYQCISACCRGKYRHAGGFLWAYSNGEDTMGGSV